MSWNGYIDNLIAQSQQNADQVCIIGLDGGAAWTTPDHAGALAILPEEASVISKCFKSKDFTVFQANGVRVCGQKYQFLRNEDKVVLAKKKDIGGICMQATKTAIVIAHHPEGSQAGMVNKGLGTVCDYLESMNY